MGMGHQFGDRRIEPWGGRAWEILATERTQEVVIDWIYAPDLRKFDGKVTE